MRRRRSMASISPAASRGRITCRRSTPICLPSRNTKSRSRSTAQKAWCGSPITSYLNLQDDGSGHDLLPMSKGPAKLRLRTAVSVAIPIPVRQRYYLGRSYGTTFGTPTLYIKHDELNAHAYPAVFGRGLGWQRLHGRRCHAQHRRHQRPVQLLPRRRRGVVCLHDRAGDYLCRLPAD